MAAVPGGRVEGVVAGPPLSGIVAHYAEAMRDYMCNDTGWYEEVNIVGNSGSG